MNRYIRFDWAAKNILRNKADFAIFEGLISVLVNEKVTIVQLLDTESNKETASDKYNRVDIKALNCFNTNCHKCPRMDRKYL